MKIKDEIERVYFTNQKREEKNIGIVYNNIDKDYSSFLASANRTQISKFQYYFFYCNDIRIAKQALFTACKCDEHSLKFFDKGFRPTYLTKIFYLLLSDSDELLNSFFNWKFNKHDYWLKKGALGLIIQAILKEDIPKAFELLNVFEDKHKTYPLKQQDANILKAIIENDKKEVEKLLEYFLLPENHKKCNDPLMLHSKLFSLHATGLAKLAWIKGIKVEVDHPLLPMKLLPINPNEEYVIEYDFLKPDYVPNVRKLKELPNPNPKYRKDWPKNTIGITKTLLDELIRQNWDATYTEKELKNNIDVIYEAFTDPQLADTKHYDFAKLGNYHISHSKNGVTYIEERPFSNMWTIMSNEVDYFFEIVNVCFDIMGIKLVDGKQYENLKKILESNSNKKRGFFNRIFNN